MAFQKENTNDNGWLAGYDDRNTSFGSALFEITEKATKVRTLLEEKRRNEEICSLILASNESSLNSDIRKEIIRGNHAFFSKFADLIEAKLLDLSEKNEKCMSMNIERNIKASNEAIRINSTEIIEKISSSITKGNDINSLSESLVKLLLEHRNNIKDSLTDLVDTINQRESKISQEVCKFIKEHDEKEKSIYLSQLSIIQKQYELIIRDLRRRNMFLERDIESKQFCEKKLHEQIKSMDKEVKEAILVLEKKDFKINFLNSQLSQLKDENQELRDKNINLLNKNQEITANYSNKYCLLKNKYLFLGIRFLHGTIENLISSRCREIFDILKYNSKFNSFNLEMTENLTKTCTDSTKYDLSTQIPIKINESNLFDLLDVEKRIKEQEKERSLINALISMIDGQNYTQLASFTRIINQKRVEILTKVFSILKI